MAPLWHELEFLLGDGTTLHARFTTRALGDLHVDAPSNELAERRRRVTTAPLVWLHQVHGTQVLAIEKPGDVNRLAGSEADGALTGLADVALSVTAADCAPVLLWDPAGTFATVHAGWRGVADGILQSAVGKLRRRGAETVSAALGPCIGPSSYEFGDDQLDVVASALGDEVRGVTDSDKPALDLPAAVRSALAAVDVQLISSISGDTALDSESYFSHRARQDAQRQALIAWKS